MSTNAFRKSRQVKHLESIEKIFTEYDDKIRMRSNSPQPIHAEQSQSAYPSSRFAIHRPKTPQHATNITSKQTRRHSSNTLKPTKTQSHSHSNLLSKHLSGTSAPSSTPIPKDDYNAAVPSIVSMFDTDMQFAPTNESNTKLKSAEKDKRTQLHSKMNGHSNSNSNGMSNGMSNGNGTIINTHIPDYNTEIMLHKLSNETQSLNRIGANYQSLQKEITKVVREQSVCIQELMNELQQKNEEITRLKLLLRHQKQKQKARNERISPMAIYNDDDHKNMDRQTASALTKQINPRTDKEFVFNFKSEPMHRQFGQYK